MVTEPVAEQPPDRPAAEVPVPVTAEMARPVMWAEMRVVMAAAITTRISAHILSLIHI